MGLKETGSRFFATLFLLFSKSCLISAPGNDVLSNLNFFAALQNYFCDYILFAADQSLVSSRKSRSYIRKFARKSFISCKVLMRNLSGESVE
jgi:hypothetical protein